MAKRVPPLTDTKISKAKPQEKQYTFSDGGGLYLLIVPSGGKLWRFKYRYAGKEKLISFGAYPYVSLLDARNRREDARKLLANNVDPGAVKKALKTSTFAEVECSFEVVAREWHTKQAPTWADSHAYWVMRRLEQYVFPSIGAVPINDLKPVDVLKVLRRIESVALETAHRVKFIFSQIFRYAVATDRAERDPSADLKGALPPRSTKHHPSLTDPKDVAPFLRSIDNLSGCTFVVKSALQLAPLVFVRPGELRQAMWSEIDLDSAEWNIPIERMKLRKTLKDSRKGEKHLVPLARQAVSILRELRELTGRSPYVFPSARSNLRCMSNEAVNAAIERMGYKGEITGHGFRAMARTIIDEVLQVKPDIIEHQLGHAVRDPLGRAYNRTSHLAERRKMMQTWADYLDELKAGAKVIPLKRADG